jgi:hypothetical protein
MRALRGMDGVSDNMERKMGHIDASISCYFQKRRSWRSLHSSLECPRSSGEALPGSGCRPPRWRFSVTHSPDGHREFPRRSTRVWDRRWRWVFASVCIQAEGRLPADCAMAALSEDRRSPVSGQLWSVILGIGSPSPRKSALCFHTENRLRSAAWR